MGYLTFIFVVCDKGFQKLFISGKEYTYIIINYLVVIFKKEISSGLNVFRRDRRKEKNRPSLNRGLILYPIEH